MDVNQILNSGLIEFLPSFWSYSSFGEELEVDDCASYGCILSIIFSSSGKKLFDKWQFCNTIHCAVFLDFSIMSFAFSPWPFPRDTGTTRCPFSSPSLVTWSIGSFPGVKMSKIGWCALLFAKTSFRSMIIGVVKYAPSVFFTNLRIAKVVNSGLIRRIRGIQAKWGS